MPDTTPEQRRIAQLERLHAGNRDALQQLILDYHGPLRSAVAAALHSSGFVGCLDPDDVLQEAYVAAFESVSGCRFDGAAAFYAWLEAIALNKLWDMQRALRRRKRDVARNVALPAGPSTSYPDLFQRLAAAQSTPSRQVARGEAVAVVMTCLARLTCDQRTVITQRFLENRAVAEIAAALGKTDAAVHMLTHRGLKELRALMTSITGYLTGG